MKTRRLLRPVIYRGQCRKQFKIIFITEENKRINNVVCFDKDMHFTAELFKCGSEIFLQNLHNRFEFFIHNHYCSHRRLRQRKLIAEEATRAYFTARSLNFSPFTFSYSVTTPWINASGRGGQPATYTSTGTISSTPCTMA